MNPNEQTTAPSNEDQDWAAAIAVVWAQDWSDPREDIYSLDDSEPANGTRE